MKKLLILISILLLSGCIPRDDTEVIVTYLNDGIDILTVGEEHVDTGCEIIINDIPRDMEVITNTFNKDILGRYVIKYLYTHNDISYNCERYIKVVDDVVPVISLNAGIDTIKVGEEFIDAGTIYSDNFDLNPVYEVISISLGYTHSSLLTSTGVLYLFGSSDSGESGSFSGVIPAS